MNASNIESRILHEDNHLLVVNKLPSEIVQGDKTGDEPLSEKIKFYIKVKYNKPGEVFLGVVHRIDRPVSGAVIFARTSKSLTRLNELLKTGTIQKTYWAVVKNKPPRNSDRLINYIWRDEARNKSYIRSQEDNQTQIADLIYKVIDKSTDYYLLEINLITGRHHQIRAQLSHIGCPVRGDLKYGYPRSNADGSIHLHSPGKTNTASYHRTSSGGYSLEPFHWQTEHFRHLRFTNYSPDTTFTLQSISMPVPQYETSLFSEHKLQIRDFHISAHQHYPSDWIVISFLAGLIIVAWLQFFYFKRLRQIYYAPLSQRFLNILTKDGSLFKERIAVALTLIYMFTFSLLLSMILKNFIPETLSRFHDFQIFAICATSLVFFWLLKISAIWFLGIVFRTIPSTQDYLQNILAFSFITGLILLPLLILAVFLHSNILLYIILIIIGLLYFFRVMRGVFIGISLKKFSWLFLFVYLCTLEILPLLVILKGLYLISMGFWFH